MLGVTAGRRRRGAPCWRTGASPSSTCRLPACSPWSTGPPATPWSSTARSTTTWRFANGSGSPPTNCARPVTPRCFYARSGTTAPTCRPGCAGCSPLPSGRRAIEGSCWPETRSGSSRCTCAETRIQTGGWTFAFASEVRALLASGLLGRPRLDARAAASVVWNGFVVGPGTAIEGVESMWPGELRLLDRRGREQRSQRFWSIPSQQIPGRGDEEGLAAVLGESVRLHLASDVPLAVFLSGGVDSSAVANLATRASKTPVHTFTLAFEEEAFNEGPHARRIAEAIGTEHREVMLTEGDFVGGLEAAMRRPRPADLRRRQRLLHVARHPGGWFHCGAGRLRRRRAVWRVHLLPRPPGVAPLVGAARPGPAPGAGGRLAAGGFRTSTPRASGASPDPLGQAPGHGREGRRPSRAIPTRLRALPAGVAGARSWRGSRWRTACRRRCGRGCRQEPRARTPLAAIGVMEQRIFLGERLLRDNDAASMAASIEQRLPLVDQTVLEYVDPASRRPALRPHPAEGVAAACRARGLSPALFERPKRGFVLPFERWLRARLGQRVEETLHDQATARAVGLEPRTVAALWTAFKQGAPGIHWTRLWAIYVLMQWCQLHGVAR